MMPSIAGDWPPKPESVHLVPSPYIAWSSTNRVVIPHIAGGARHVDCGFTTSLLIGFTVYPSRRHHAARMEKFSVATREHDAVASSE